MLQLPWPFGSKLKENCPREFFLKKLTIKWRKHDYELQSLNQCNILVIAFIIIIIIIKYNGHDCDSLRKSYIYSYMNK